MQGDLFGYTQRRKAHFLIYHDESEPAPNKGWLLIGLLFVRSDTAESVRAALKWYRNQEKYYGEIHFSDLPKSFEGPFGKKARVARRWMRAYQEGLCENAFFTCLAVNRTSPRFEHKRFEEEYHAYNRFTAMAIKAGISYFLAPLGYHELELTVFSDEKERKSRPDQNMVDNFEDYLVYRVELDTFLRQVLDPHYPTVAMKPVQTINSAKDDLLQLTDLLLGATQVALSGKSQRLVKRELGSMVVSWYLDLKKRPSEQAYKMHRKFNLWGFPDEEGRPFSNFAMALPPCSGQLELF
ncbi:MAG: hypothetical protein KatS3mg025_1416 [Bacteroidia bacterium]|jgi:hypothetical protein|nr:MAG: hypothetical protein KatS3mg025_1416 [Bacteroidia bacterium]